MKTVQPKTLILACGIFKEELEHILARPGWEGVDVQWLGVGLHNDIDRLAATVEEELVRAREEGRDQVRLLFGRGCAPGLDALAAARGVAILGGKNCLAAMVGDEELTRLEGGRTMVMTPGWVRQWREIMIRDCGWTEVDFRMNLGRYDRLLILDAGLSPFSDEEILEFFDLVQVPVDFLAIDLAGFERRLQALLA